MEGDVEVSAFDSDFVSETLARLRTKSAIPTTRHAAIRSSCIVV